MELGVWGYPPQRTRRDLNPGPPAPQDDLRDIERRKVALVANLRQHATDGNVKAFYEFLINERKISEKTAKEYISALTKPYRDTRNSQKAYRLFAKFLASRGIISEEFAEKILKVVKIKKTNADLYIPTIDGIRKTLQLAKEYSENVYAVYRLALESGTRLSEILKVLREPEKDICDGAICYYPLSWSRGYKGSFYLFHVTPLQRISITRSAIADFERRTDAIAIKYFRKFVASKMAELGISLDVIDFIQGRKPTRVLTQHYVSLFGIAKENYKKYAEWLKHNI
nr:integrase [Saccharolobus solfataricus]